LLAVGRDEGRGGKLLVRIVTTTRYGAVRSMEYPARLWIRCAPLLAASTDADDRAAVRTWQHQRLLGLLGGQAPDGSLMAGFVSRARGPKSDVRARRLEAQCSLPAWGP